MASPLSSLSPSPLARPRPSGPGRSKRHSLTPTSRANIPPSPGGRGGPNEKHGVMGGLRERSEEELRRAGREELVSALKEEWDHRDKVREHVDALEGERRRLEKERRELMQSLGGLQARVDDAFNEQSRLEADLEGRDELLEKMRTRISEGEKAIRDGQRRYTEQERSFEAEREAFRAQETHLQTRIKNLSAVPSTTSKPPSPTSHPDTELLQEELASLSASHCTLIAQLNTVSTELGDLKERNKILEEENAGWELLMRDRTLNGGMRGKGLLGEEWLDEEGESEDEDQGTRGKGRKGRKSGLEALDEEMEGMMGDPTSSPEEVKVGFGSAKAGRQRKKEGSKGVQESGSGMDLAAELDRAQETTGEDAAKSLTKGDDSETLRAEVKQLRESNKALTLYCSKIIDRIIAQEGFEHVLAVDYKTRRLNAQRSNAALGRTSVHDIVRNMQGEVPPPVPSLPASMSATEPLRDIPAKAPAVKKARPMSMMARAFSTGPVEEKTEVVIAPVPAVARLSKDEEVKAAKKAKRGFSIDFRSFGFGAASAPTPSPPEPKGLKPLQLPRRTASTSSPPSVRIPSPPIISPSEYTARKLDPQAEDEEDRRERHRMEAAMRLMGIDRSTPAAIQEESDDAPYFPTVRPGSESSSTASRTTPLSRLSSHLATTSNGRTSLSPQIELLDPLSPVDDSAAMAALAAFDKKEQEQAKMIAKGTYQTEFTSPGGSSIRDRRASMRRGSNAGSPGRTGKGVTKGRVSKSESISTLWSAGSGSRPGSMEVKQDEI